ncbi:MAG: PIN domain-containing protein [Candidatus Helarchaeota archaeon]|nr:PIN domain-containing protein [Candidatus Helarchaeota archaeon]
MPMIELDLIIGFLSETDNLHATALKIFQDIQINSLKNVRIPTSALLELELLLRSKKVADMEINKDITHIVEFPNLIESPLNSSTLILAQKLRTDYPGLTFFDSLHCASALLFDNKIISSDNFFDKIEELTRIKPLSLTKEPSE